MDNQVRTGIHDTNSSAPVPIFRRVYKRNCIAKVKFLPIDQVKKLAAGTRKRRTSTKDSSNSSSQVSKKFRSSNSFSSNLTEQQGLVKVNEAKQQCIQPNDMERGNFKAPPSPAFSLEGSSSDASKLSLSFKDKTLKVGVASKSDQPEKSEVIKEKGIGHQSDCSNLCKVQRRGLSSASPACKRYLTNGPASERIWKGNFEVPDLPQELRQCEGFTAHCSATISTKAYIFLKHIEGALHFKSHSRRDFCKADVPDLQDIAVYFYPGKFERSRREYASLLKFIEKEDLMLHCAINHVELLVYPSKLLPVDSQRLGDSYFLWGALRSLRGQERM